MFLSNFHLITYKQNISIKSSQIVMNFQFDLNLQFCNKNYR